MANPDEVLRLSDEICDSPKGMREACVDCPDQGLELFDALIAAMPDIRACALACSAESDDLLAAFDTLVKAKATRDAEDAENAAREQACDGAQAKIDRLTWDKG